MAQPFHYPFQYAQLPTYGYQTFDRNAVSFSFHPIIPPDRIYPSNPFADDQMKPDDEPPPSEESPEPRPEDAPAEAQGTSRWPGFELKVLIFWLDNNATGDGDPPTDSGADGVIATDESGDPEDKGILDPNTSSLYSD
jgi:hypothetical protein